MFLVDSLDYVKFIIKLFKDFDAKKFSKASHGYMQVDVLRLALICEGYMK